jgi:hypothetical protein
MTVKGAILWVLAGVVVVYLLLLVLMLPVHATSGSGEGNILTTHSP